MAPRDSLGALTTHVLDTAQGCPAAGMVVELWGGLDDSDRALLLTATTNSQGRTDAPLCPGGGLRVQTYELLFYVGDYLRRQSLSLPDRLFLDQVPIRFGISDPDSHYHVPLLVSPWSYSTYRGS